MKILPCPRPLSNPLTRCLRPLATLLLCGAAFFPVRAAAAVAEGEGVRIPVPYTASGKGFLSLALYDKDGTLVRTLLSAEPVEPGQGTVPWDATTDLGVPVAAGSYTAKGIFFTEQPSLSWVMKVGKDGNPPWRIPDGTGDWGGNLGSAVGLTSNSSSMVLAVGCVEDHQITGVQQMDADGNISLRYHTFYPWDQRSAAAMDEQNLYLAILKDCEELQIAEYTLGEPGGRILTKLPAEMQITPAGLWRGRGDNVVDGIALTDSRVFASVGANDELYIIDRASGDILKTVTVSGPRGLAVHKDRLLIASGEQVLRYTLEGEPDGIAVDKGTLQAANTLTVGSDGTIWVGDSGRFHPDPMVESGTKRVYGFNSSGAVVQAIGKPGGAPRDGIFDPAALGDIRGMALTPDGSALMINDVATGFSRTSRWSLDGQLQRQWFLRSIEGNRPDATNPARPEELVHVAGSPADMIKVQAYNMDFEKKTWQPAWHYSAPLTHAWQDEVVIGYKHSNQLMEGVGHPETTPTFGWGASGGLRTFKGRNYMLSREGTIYTYAPDEAPKLVAMAFTHRSEVQEDKIQQYYDRGPNTWFTWADHNGDARVQMEETIVTGGDPRLEDISRMDFARFDDNLDILISGLHDQAPEDTKVYRQFRLPLQEVLANGAPVYDWNQLEEVTPELQWPDLTGGDGEKIPHRLYAEMPLKDGNSQYVIIAPAANKELKLPGIDGDGWWASRNWRKKIARFDLTTGECLWAVGRRAPGLAKNGEMYNPTSIIGVAENAVFLTDALAVVWVWDENGLYLGQLYNGPEDRKSDENTIYIELMGANLVRHLDRTWLLTNDFGASVHEVHMPARQPVDEGTVMVSADAAANAIPWDPEGQPPTQKPVSQVRYLPAHEGTTEITIDGKLDGPEGWGSLSGTENPFMMVLLDGERLAKVRALWDDENLYLGYNVSAPHGPINSGSEAPISPFVSGAYIDARFGPDWKQPQRPEVREGDVRLIFARLTGNDGEPELFHRGYWEKKTGGTGAETIASPAAQLRMEQIAEIPGLQVAWEIGQTHESGMVDYTVEIAIPLAEIGLGDVQPGRKIGFDTSVGVANASGDRRDRASHWSGLSEAIVVDRPGSHRLLPQNWGTLEFMAE